MDYEYWASLTEANLEKQDIAKVHLTCASGLPPTGDLDVDAILRNLDDRAEIIWSATARAIRMRGNQPDYDGLSDSHFRIVCLGSMLRKMGMKMNFTKDNTEYDATDCRDFFIHAAFDSHPITCVPIAILFAVMCRRLAYPVKLVNGTRHIFCRWEGPDGERFNFEPTSFGQHSHSDEHYRTWPYPQPKHEQHFKRFLRHFSPIPTDFSRDAGN